MDRTQTFSFAARPMSLERLEPRELPSAVPLLHQARPRYAVGTGEGHAAQINVYDGPTNALLGTINPFPASFTGGVRVATADVTGDGIEDVIAAAGPGGAAWVKVFDGKTLLEVRAFLAYTASFSGGVMVAAGDVTGDGRADIVTGAGVGGGPHVQAFSGAALFPTGDVHAAVEPFAVKSFYAYEHGFRGGISVAVGDVDGDGTQDIVTGAGPGGGPRVVVHSGATGKVLYSYFAYEPTFTGGVFVSAADLTDDGKAEVITGAGKGGVYEVKSWSGIYRESQYTAFTDNKNAGVRVSAQDLTGDGEPEVIVAAGSGRDPWVKVLNGQTWATMRSNPAVMPIYTGGLFVG